VGSGRQSRAGPGGLACSLIGGPDESRGGEQGFHVRAWTWLAAEMLEDEKILLVGDGRPGFGLGDHILLPPPWRRIVRNGEPVEVRRL
jgi:hypothetical protein